MNQTFFDRIPTNLPGGFFVYRAMGAEELCFADKNVLDMYGCDDMDAFRELTDNSFRGMVHPEDLEQVEGEIYQQTFYSGGRHDYVHYRIRTRQGEVRYVEDFGHLVYDNEGDSFFYVFIVEMEPEEYLRMSREDWDKRIRYSHEEKRNVLTGLICEKEFYAVCEQHLADVRINWLLLAIDLQNFKLFNEWYGRETGDRVLADVGRELAEIADRHGGVAGYFCGDDFALLVPAAHFDTEELFDRVHNTVISHGASVGFLPSIGASYSQGNMSAYTLYDQASLAGKEAKGSPTSQMREKACTLSSPSFIWQRPWQCR